MTEQEKIAKLIANLERDIAALKKLIVSGESVDVTLSDEPEDVSGGYVMAGGFMPMRHGGTSLEDSAIEGTFDGERMVDANGKSYQVPPNYASKSKLVEGDPLKLYITADGKYLYKQLGPVERRTVPGVLKLDGSRYIVDAEDGNVYGILTACVTYYMSLYNIKEGDKVIAMIPADRPAHWAVIDNVAD